MRNKWRSTKTATKLAVVGTALLAAALYAYTTFSPRYENGDQQRTGIEKIASDAENVFSDAKSIADYVRKEFQPAESYKE
jgi:dienelactone hydrolase